MAFTDLLRLTVLLAAAEATVLGAVTAVSASAHGETRALIVAGIWWPLAVAIGLYLGRRPRALEGVRGVLAAARTATTLPDESPGRIAAARLWPIGLSAVIAGALGFFLPGVAAVGAGYALLVALAWRTREAAVLGVEDRDGVKFYVDQGSALRPVRLIRTPGLGRDRPKPGHPPPPPPAV